MSHPNFVHLLEKIEEQSQWRICSNSIKSRECTIYRAESHETGRTVAIKAYLPATSLAAPQKQYEALSIKQGDLTDPHASLRIPHAYSFDTDSRTLLMGWGEGKSLVSFLWSPQRPAAMKKNVSLAGRWLRAFHATPQLKESTVNLNTYVTIVEKRQDRSDTTPSSYLFRETLDTLKTYIRKHPKCPAPHAIPHGDFTPYNLLINGETVTGIDMWGLKDKPIFQDLARMTVYLTIAYPCFFLGKLYDQQGRMNPKITVLYTSYGTDKVDTSSKHLKLALLSEYLRRWLVIDNRRSGFLRRLTDRFQILRIQQQIRSIIATM